MADTMTRNTISGLVAVAVGRAASEVGVGVRVGGSAVGIAVGSASTETGAGTQVLLMLTPKAEPPGDLLFERHPSRGLESLILPEAVEIAVLELVEEQLRSDLLRAYNLEPRNRVLLTGPPGNGKTTLAEAVADAQSVPFLTVRYDAIIGSYLGETAQRISQVFDYARSRECVLFFDEFDAVAKERGDVNETLVMTNAGALTTLRLRFDEFRRNPDARFPGGLAPLRHVFEQLRAVRFWDRRIVSRNSVSLRIGVSGWTIWIVELCCLSRLSCGFEPRRCADNRRKLGSEASWVH